MNFSKIIQKKSKILLPLSWLYRLGVTCHSFLYNSGIKKSVSFDMPVICVGNLSVGGTGKTPMVEYLLKLLSKKYRVAVISRGYKRKTRGFLIAGEHTKADDIGDEPMQFYKKFSDAKIAVGENRVQAINELIKNAPQIDAIVLDDAFQHRAVQAGFNLLLTEYDNLFVNDFYLPAGQLRDLKSNYKRADIIIITKSPANLSSENKNKIIDQVKPFSHQIVLFTSFKYEEPYNIFTKSIFSLELFNEILLVTGIANPSPLIQYLDQKVKRIHLQKYSDHHHFSKEEINLIKEKYFTINNDKKTIITTEKDAMRLFEFEKDLLDVPVLAIPVAHHFLFEGETIFEKHIIQYIENKYNGKKK
ncbi:MAG TPA: tetraacyldisaccharide 4'-kinase [Niabella sp.]|nr:tetraacyldisaccharide 4'-kinase [Chitinophagaceae bacterium]HRN48819.1 tetraacyldisaccharide 4'-kinase [Niabella sp.]HRO84667.1 tetraacyldisaccharide 4'-kinase [Niabella sp.]HUN02086.1 tetraacyldisaccharide 4'-kinase [Niabella sp.]